MTNFSDDCFIHFKDSLPELIQTHISAHISIHRIRVMIMLLSDFISSAGSDFFLVKLIPKLNCPPRMNDSISQN